MTNANCLSVFAHDLLLEEVILHHVIESFLRCCLACAVALTNKITCDIVVIENCEFAAAIRTLVGKLLCELFCSCLCCIVKSAI